MQDQYKVAYVFQLVPVSINLNNRKGVFIATQLN